MTTEPNELIASIHNRMPVILAPAAAGRLPLDLLRPFPADQMSAWKVSRAVGNVKNDLPSLVEPIH